MSQNFYKKSFSYYVYLPGASEMGFREAFQNLKKELKKEKKLLSETYFWYYIVSNTVKIFKKMSISLI